MLNDIETIGLKVEIMNPNNGQINVDTNTDIKIKFNAHLNKNTIINNVILYEQLTNERVSCGIKCNEDTMILSPKTELNVDTVYGILIKKDGVSDILGRKPLIDFNYSFTTLSTAKVKKPTIIYPTNQNSFDSLTSIKFISDSVKNVIEISSSKDFNILDYTVTTNCIAFTEHTVNIQNTFNPGTYYIRILGNDETYSDLTQFIINDEVGKVSDEDYSLEVDLESLLGDRTLVEFKPTSYIVDTNRRCLMFKFDNKISIDEIKKCKHSIYGETVDTDNEEILEHGFVDYNMTYLYNSVENATYIIFELCEVNK